MTTTDITPTGDDILDLDATGEEIDISHLVDGLAELARNSDEPVVLMAGRFAMYPMSDGGVMFVTECPVGLLSMAGVKRTRIPPAMLRATSILVGGGSKAQALKAALFGGRGKKAVGDGR